MMILMISAAWLILGLNWVTLQDLAAKNTQFLRQKGQIQDLQDHLKSLLNDPLMCQCLMNDPAFRVDTTITDGSQMISLTSLRANPCESTSPFVISTDTAFRSMAVERIELAQLRSIASTTWQAEWRVHLTTPLGYSLAPIQIPQRFLLDATSMSTSPTDTQIASCLPDASGNGASGGKIISACEAGFEMVGPADAVGTFCIDQNERPALTQDQAVATCASMVNTALGPARLCRHSEWFAACRLATNLNGRTDNFEWNTEFGGSALNIVASGQGDCTATQSRPRYSPTTFRCCYP